MKTILKHIPILALQFAALVSLLCIIVWAVTRGLSPAIMASSSRPLDEDLINTIRYHIVLLGFLFWFWISIVVHELGHLFGALAMRLRVQAFVVIPFQLVRIRGPFRLRFYDPKTKQPLGLVMAFLPDTRRARFRMAFYISAGPLANLLGCVLCLALVTPVARTFPTMFSPNQAAYWFHLGAWLNLFFGLSNLIPFYKGNWSTDGKQLLGLLKRERTQNEINTFSICQ